MTLSRNDLRSVRAFARWVESHDDDAVLGDTTNGQTNPLARWITDLTTYPCSVSPDVTRVTMEPDDDTGTVEFDTPGWMAWVFHRWNDGDITAIEVKRCLTIPESVTPPVLV